MFKTLRIYRRFKFQNISHYSSSKHALTPKDSTKEKTARQTLQPVIGLEVHAQIASNSKLFSGAGTTFGKPVNSLVAFLDASLPGTLPVINKRCVEAGVLTALALKCHISTVSTFDRKHYFYADLPAGYQITQQNEPLAKNGQLTFWVTHPDTRRRQIYEKTVHIIQLQLEQDSGKSLHDDVRNYSLIDLNRAGVGLMEIVTGPEFSSGEEATSFVKELQLILQRIGTCSAHMDEGALRVDASISLHEPGQPLGTRTEVKNINSIRYIARAIDFEISRQQQILEDGGEVENETRTFDYETGETLSMRDKEKLHDYRFMPEPNLPPLRIYHTDSIPKGIDPSQVVNIDELSHCLPELPEQQRSRLTTKFDLNPEHVILFVSDHHLCSYFEQVMEGRDRTDSKSVANILVNDLMAILNERDITFAKCKIPPEQIKNLVDLLQSRKISSTTSRQILEELFENGGDALEIVAERKLWQISDKSSLESVCEEVIEANPQAVRDFQNGKKKSLNFLLGQVQKQTKGTADGKIVVQIMTSLLQK